MRVILNTLCTLGHKSGPGHYTAELFRCLRQREAADYLSYPEGKSADVQRWLARQSALYERTAARRDPLSRLRTIARGKTLALLRKTILPPYPQRFEAAARAQHCELYHEPLFPTMACELPAVATVPDLTALHHPEWHAPQVASSFERDCRDNLGRFRHLLAFTQAGKRDIVRTLGVRDDMVSVTPAGVRPNLRRVNHGDLRTAAEELRLPEGYLLHVGALETRKNLVMLLRAYLSLPASLRSRNPLMLVGGTGFGSEPILDLLTQHRNENIHYRGYLEERHLAAVYSGARALVLPSFSEGVALPAAEMLACGGVVIAAKTPVLAEVTNGYALLVDPHDEAGWRDALVKVCRDRDWRLDMRKKAREVSARSWEHCAEETLAAYRRATHVAASQVRLAA